MRVDRVIHEPGRLRIVTYLAGADKRRAAFGEIQDALGFTSGNLSVQLKKLQEALYVTIEKSFVDNRPHTSVTLTSRGFRALEGYLAEMEALIRSVRD